LLAWLAVIEHVPIVSSVTSAPETLQTAVLFEASATARPELAGFRKFDRSARRT